MSGSKIVDKERSSRDFYLLCVLLKRKGHCLMVRRVYSACVKAVTSIQVGKQAKYNCVQRPQRGGCVRSSVDQAQLALRTAHEVRIRVRTANTMASGYMLAIRRAEREAFIRHICISSTTDLLLSLRLSFVSQPCYSSKNRDIS